ncbi:MAG: DUF3014 domain-containing protein [Comamonadaceae bacterium]|nr:MAG: DUF3014 domain-containing protein [Comamonadaceae bacterium]
MPERDPAEFRPARESSAGAIVLILLILAAAAGGWWYWTHREPATPVPSPTAAAPQPDLPSPPPAAAASGPLNPINALAEPDAVLPALADSDGAVVKALRDLLGGGPVSSFLQTDGFVRRVVATVDNLPRAQAPPRMWPVQPAPQRFSVSGVAQGEAIAADNAARYTPFVRFAESIDVANAVTLYARLYPLFQQAYEELGYPGRYFNDRLIAVIDHLLQAPEPQTPPRVTLTEVKGDVAVSRPWVRYEFADPQLEALSSGQKLLVRMGLDNERRLKARLIELRRQVATGSMAKKP